MGSTYTAEIPVFANTSSGTHFAVAVSPGITTRELKRELERAHSSCFPNLGNVVIDALMVKKKAFFYHLPDAAPVKHFFEDFERSWFLHLSVKGLNCNRKFKKKSGFKRKKATWFCKFILLGSTLTFLLSRKRRRRRHRAKSFQVKCKPVGDDQVCWDHSKENTSVSGGLKSTGERNDHRKELYPIEEKNSNTETVQSHCESLSETAPSISGIIKRYFSGIIELNLTDGLSRSEATSCRTPKLLGMTCYRDQTPTPLRKCLGTASVGDEIGRYEVGKRLVLALSEVKASQAKQKCKTPLCNPNERKRLFAPGAAIPVKSLVFEMSDHSD